MNIQSKQYRSPDRAARCRRPSPILARHSRAWNL